MLLDIAAHVRVLQHRAVHRLATCVSSKEVDESTKGTQLAGDLKDLSEPAHAQRVQIIR